MKGTMTQDDYECFLLSATASVTAVKVPGATETHNVIFPESIGNDAERAAYTYNVYGSDTQVGTYDLVLADVAASPDASGNITATVSDTRKFYYVTTSYNGKESKGSKVVAPASYPPASITVSRNAVIPNTTPSYTVAFADGGPNAKGVMPVKITWTKSSANDAYGYVVYRSKFNQKKQAYGSFTAITDVLSADTLSYIDTNATAVQEEIYGYKVMATNILGQGAASSYSDAAWGYGALCVEQLMAQSSKTSKYAQRPPSQGGGLVALNQADDNAKMTG